VIYSFVYFIHGKTNERNFFNQKRSVMTLYYQIDDCLFYPQVNEIHRDGEVLKVRPKTAELLILLLKANGQIVSKHELLEQIWNDVVVDDHVVFQSMTELRKLFGERVVIKTHPRKGYSISSEIKECVDVVKDQRKTIKPSKYLMFSITSFLVVLVITFLFIQFQGTPVRDSNSGSIVVLPVKSKITDSDHLWLRYGGMDQLINYLKPQSKISPLHTEDVLDIVERADVDIEQIDSNAVSRIFDVSGAELIIEQTISGSPRDYQLVYSLHYRDKTNRGALFSADVKSMFFELSSVVLQLMGVEKKDENRSYQSDFANEIVANALDQLQAKNFNNVVTLLEAVLIAEPKNLMANRLLSQALIHLGRFSEAQQILSSGIAIAEKENNEAGLVRLLFWKALSLTQQGELELALTTLSLAKEKAKSVNDVLYLANSSRIEGRIYLAQGRYDKAEAEFKQALSFHQTIQCPFGQSNTLIDLGELNYQRDEVNSSRDFFNQALLLAEQRHLRGTANVAQSWLSKLESSSK